MKKNILVRQSYYNEQWFLTVLRKAIAQKWRVALITQQPVNGSFVSEPEYLFGHYCHGLGDKVDTSVVEGLNSASIIIKISNAYEHIFDKLMERAPAPMVVQFSPSGRHHNAAACFHIESKEELDHDAIIYNIMDVVSEASTSMKAVDEHKKAEQKVQHSIKFMRIKMPPRRGLRVYGIRKRKWYKRQP